MTGGKRDGTPGTEMNDVRPGQWVEAAAELVLHAERLIGPAPLPDFGDLRSRRLRARVRQRAGFAVISVAAAAAFGLVLVIVLSGRNRDAVLSYVVEGTSTVEPDTIEAPMAPAGSAARQTRVRFSDGTVVALEPGARLRIPARTTVGAELVLDRGRSSFAVAHRSGARWRVAAGPFTVDVTGTRFWLEWKADVKRLTLDLAAGGVVVRGDAAEPGVAVRPGERLVASTTDGRVTVFSAAGTSPDQMLAAGTNAAPVQPGARAVEGHDRVARDHGGSTPSAAPGTLSRAGASVDSISPRRRHPPTHRLAATSPGRKPSEPPDGLRADVYRPDLQPPPVTIPSAHSLTVGGGGVFCAADRAAYGFEDAPIGVSVAPLYHLALSRPRPNSSHSWCGAGSLRLDASFGETGRRNFMGRLPHQSGQVVIRLPHLMDFTDKTVGLHVFVEGPPQARLAAQMFIIQHGKWVNGPVVDNLTPGRWWTISHKFRAENPLTVGPPYPPAGTSQVTECDRIALIVYATGGPRTWSGAIYVDDLGWN